MIISDLITVKVANENYIVPGNMVKLAPTHLSKNILSHMAQRYAHWPATQASKPISSWSRSMATVEAMVEEGGDISLDCSAPITLANWCCAWGWGVFVTGAVIS